MQMEKLLVGLYVPAVQEHFDLFVPARLKIAELTELMATGVNDLSDGQFSQTGMEMLCLRDPDLLLQPEKSLQDYGIEDGTQMILI